MVLETWVGHVVGLWHHPRALPQLGLSPGRAQLVWEMPGACCIYSQNLCPRVRRDGEGEDGMEHIW